MVSSKSLVKRRTGPWRKRRDFGYEQRRVFQHAFSEAFGVVGRQEERSTCVKFMTLFWVHSNTWLIPVCKLYTAIHLSMLERRTQCNMPHNAPISAIPTISITAVHLSPPDLPSVSHSHPPPTNPSSSATVPSSTSHPPPSPSADPVSSATTPPSPYPPRPAPHAHSYTYSLPIAAADT
jgi:hypothetical protein